jgi:hypothetical protein
VQALSANLSGDLETIDQSAKGTAIVSAQFAAFFSVNHPTDWSNIYVAEQSTKCTAISSAIWAAIAS